MCSKVNYLQLLELISLFIHGKISTVEFERDYIIVWRSYRDYDNKSNINSITQEYLDCVFTALDTYCSDPELRDDNDFDDSELLDEVIRLNNIWEIKVHD